MLKNLLNVLDEKSITYSQLAEAIGYKRYATVSEKVNGKTKFTFDEALKIKNVFFPEYDLEYLFYSEDEVA